MIWIVGIGVVVAAAAVWLVARTLVARVVIGCAAGAALLAYALVGSPDDPDLPLAARLVEIENLARSNPEEINGAQAMALLQERARRSPDDPAPHMAMGELMMQVGRPSEAMLSYRAALRRAPQNAAIADAISELDFQMTGEIDRATLERMGEIRARARTAPESLTNVQLMAILKDRAVDAPEDPVPHKIMGDILQSIGRTDDAMAAYEASVALQADYRDAVKALADMRFKASGEVDARTTELYHTAYRLDPEDLRIGYLAGIGDWQAGKKAEAEALWAKIEAQTPEGDPRAQMFKALRETFAVEG